ncbi:MAG: EAL domain-containing protein [Solirubrobacteraceae bacterium]
MAKGERKLRSRSVPGPPEELNVREELSVVLREFARTMVTDFPIQGILDHLVKRIVEILPITGAGVTLITPGLDPRYVAASNPSALGFERLQTELGEGPCLTAYLTGETVFAPDLTGDRRFPEFSPRALAIGLTAVFTFPLRHGDLLLGALDLYRDVPGPLSREVTEAAQTLAEVAAAYLINAQARSDLQDSSDQSRDAALHDGLTGLPNRTLLMQRLEHAFQRGSRSGGVTALFFVDLDHFKAVNDTYGHQVGDELLVAVGQRLTEVLRPGDSLARLSGDEFVVLCEELDDASQADAIAARFDAALTRPFSLTGLELKVRASIGIAYTGRGSDAPEGLIRDADLAMYRSKRHKREPHQVLDLRSVHLRKPEAGLARSLPGAWERGEMHVAYQPIVATIDAHVTGVEALLRWTHPNRGPIGPTTFVPFAEQSGQILDLGHQVLAQAWRDRFRWQRHRDERLEMSVNVSAHQFMSSGFAASVASVLDKPSADPRLMTLEVTERVFVGDDDRALVVLDELKALGVKLALDDFGTGYSSLSYLTALPIDGIKIDQSFITNLGNEGTGHTVLTAIIQLAHGLGLTVIAEGVETAVQRRQLAELGANFCQGFYFARPMRAAHLEEMIRGGVPGAAQQPSARLPPDL